MNSERRVPISEGFYIQLSTEGHALHRGCDESVVLPRVESWLQRNKDHNNFALVEQWLEQKIKQMQEDILGQYTRAQREEINEIVDKSARQSRLSKNLTELVREQAFKIRGISPKED
jgi:hypothetical protein